MYQSLYSEISLLKQQAEYNYSPLYIAKMSMNILNEYLNEIIAEDRDKFISLIAMDMGEEFEYSQDECIKVLSEILKNYN